MMSFQARTALLLVSLGGSVSVAYAQEGAAGQEVADGASESRDIVVTARRREERLQDVPVAITAVSGASLERQGIVNAVDLRRVAPSLNVSETTASGRNMLAYTIRGQRTGDNLPSVDPAVGIYVGDQLFKRTYGLDGLIFDMQSIEVLKGPQGTLFGLNVTGGNVVFRPNLPNDTLGASIKGSVGNFDLRGVEGYLNVPLGAGAALRVSGQSRKRNGYIHNILDPDREYGDENGGGVRAILKLNPSASLESIFSGSYSRKSVGGTGWKLNSIPPGGTQDSLYNLECGGFCPGVLGPNFLNNLVAAAGPLGFYEIAADSQGSSRQTNDFAKLRYAWNIANTTSLQLNDAITLKNIVGYRKYDASGIDDQDGGPASVLEYGHAARGSEFSNEFQVIGNTTGLDWIIGAYYFRENVKSIALSPNVFAPFQEAILPYTTRDFDINTGKSLFASVTKDISGFISGLSATIGARYTWDKRNAKFGITQNFTDPDRFCAFNPATDPAILGFNFDPATCTVDVSKKFSQLSYSASLDWKLAPNKLIYVAHRKGYRAGAWSTRATTSALVKTADPEGVKDYEIGAKLDWNIGGAFLRTNIAAFYQDYSNIQRLTNAVLNGQIVTNFINAEKASIKGVEAEMIFQPVEWLELSGFAAYVDPKYKKFIYDSDFDGTADADVTDTATFGGVSKWQIGASAAVTLPVPESLGKARLQANWYRQTRFYTQDSTYTDDLGWTPGYGLVNARLELSNISGSGIDAALFATNLLDKKYVSVRYTLLQEAGTRSDIVGPPRMWGLELRYTY